MYFRVRLLAVLCNMMLSLICSFNLRCGYVPCTKLEGCLSLATVLSLLILAVTQKDNCCSSWCLVFRASTLQVGRQSDDAPTDQR